jgi:pyridoxamine 5'-phosphate oxidase
MKLHHHRKTYTKAELTEDTIVSNPIDQFRVWYQEALDSEILEANVMTLATATKEGKPSARIVLLKEFNSNGFVFYTNYSSRKGDEIEQNPQVELLFFWDVLERQVRIEGRIEKLPKEISEEYFYSRPIESQMGAMVSEQSKVIASRFVLEEKLQALKKEEIKMPDNWGGYLVVPFRIEFWQGRPSRLHDRIVYTQKQDAWKIERLSP